MHVSFWADRSLTPVRRAVPTSRSRTAIGVSIVALMAIVWFAGIEWRSLIEPDEGRYAEVAREMFASGDWLMPHFNGFKFYDKPPLHYWATALAYHAFGIHHWTARLWNVLTGLLCIVSVGYTAHRVWGAREGRLAALVCTGMFIVVAAAHLNSLDMGVTAFMTVALGAFLIAEHSRESAASQRRWMLVAWTAMALAVLSKGLIGIVLPGATLVVYAVWQRDTSLLRRLHPVAGVGLLLALTAPWFVALGRLDERFLPFLFIHEHVGRYLAQVTNRNQPGWYYLPILIVGLLPWTGLLPAALRDAWRRATREQERSTRIVLIWAAVVLLFFSISGAKLPLYVLPMFPALALLIGSAIPRLQATALARRLLPITVLALVGIGLALWLPNTAALKALHGLYPAFGRIAAIAAGLLAAGTGIAWLLARRGHRDAAVAAAALGGLLFGQTLLLAYQRLAPVASAQALAALARPYLRADTPVYAVETFYRGLPFYLQCPVILVAERPYDLLAGMDWEPERQIPERDSFAAVWTSHPGAVAFMPPETFHALSDQRLPMQLLAKTAEVVIVQSPWTTAGIPACVDGGQQRRHALSEAGP